MPYYDTNCVLCGVEVKNKTTQTVRVSHQTGLDILSKTLCKKHQSLRGKCLVCGVEVPKHPYGGSIPVVHPGCAKSVNVIPTTSSDQKYVSLVKKMIEK